MRGHNVPNRVMLENMFELCENNPTADVSEYKKCSTNNLTI